MATWAEKILLIEDRIDQLEGITPIAGPRSQTLRIEIEKTVPPKNIRRIVDASSFKIFGCTGVKAYNYLTLPYTEGDILFYKSKAQQRGLLERVFVQRIAIETRSLRCVDHSIYAVMYIDSYNGRWHEDELCSHSDAIDLAIEYYQNLLNKYRSTKKCLDF